MRYGNKSFQHINESEKRQILSLYKKMDLQNIFETKKYKTDIQELISDFGKSLETQKRYLSALFTSLPVNQSTLILNTIKEDTINNLFAQNKVVVENYYSLHNNILTEAVSDLISELEKFHKFIKNSISLELDRLNEQSDYAMDRRGNALAYSVGIRSKEDYETVNRMQDDALKKEAAWLRNAVNYITEKGVDVFFEEIRSALFSVAGTAVQIIIALTGPATSGIGPALVTGIWCIMGLYDLYQITKGKEGAWANFIIDVICALTAGSLGSVLGKFVGTAGKTLTVALQNLVSKGMGPYIIPVIYTLQKGIGAISRWFTWGGNFAKTKLGISWLADKVTPAIKYMSEIVEKIASALGKGAVVTTSTVASLIPATVLRTAGAMAAKVNPQVWGNLSNLSAQELGLFAGQTLERGALKAIEKEANSRFREEPTKKLLEYVDQTFGTAYSDAYLAYLGGKKMFKYQNGKYISAIENTANTFRGEPSYFDKQGKRIQQGVGAVAGEKPTSAEVVKKTTTPKKVGV